MCAPSPKTTRATMSSSLGANDMRPATKALGKFLARPARKKPRRHSHKELLVLRSSIETFHRSSTKFDMTSMVKAANEVELTYSSASSFPSIDWSDFADELNDDDASNNNDNPTKQQTAIDGISCSKRSSDAMRSSSSSNRSSAKRRRRRSGYSHIEIPKDLQFALSSLAAASSTSSLK